MTDSNKVYVGYVFDSNGCDLVGVFKDKKDANREILRVLSKTERLTLGNKLFKYHLKGVNAERRGDLVKINTTLENIFIKNKKVSESNFLKYIAYRDLFYKGDFYDGGWDFYIEKVTIT